MWLPSPLLATQSAPTAAASARKLLQQSPGLDAAKSSAVQVSAVQYSTF